MGEDAMLIDEIPGASRRCGQVWRGTFRLACLFLAILRFAALFQRRLWKRAGGVHRVVCHLFAAPRVFHQAVCMQLQQLLFRKKVRDKKGLFSKSVTGVKPLRLAEGVLQLAVRRLCLPKKRAFGERSERWWKVGPERAGWVYL
jgi:hypothetical protein